MRYFNLKILAQNPKSYEEKIEELKRYPRNKLFLAIENCKRQKYSESMTEEMRQAMRFFKTTIKYDYATTTAAEAYKEPVCISAGRSEIAKNYKDLAKEILQRIKEVEQHG